MASSKELKNNKKNKKSLLGELFYFLPLKGKIKTMKTGEMRKKEKRNENSRKRKQIKI